MGAPLRQPVAHPAAPNPPQRKPAAKTAEPWLREGSAVTVHAQTEQEGSAELALLPIGTGARLLPSAPSALNLSVEDRSEAERRYTVIEPLVHPAGFKVLWVAHGSRGALVAHLCKENEVSQSTLYGWLRRWKNQGMAGLVPQSRCDKGVPRALNTATYNFLCAAAVPRPGQFGEWSVQEIFRCYKEEKAWRENHVGKKLAGQAADAYARYLDEEGRLSGSALLSEASCATFRRWFIRIAEPLRVLARQGIEAFSNTQEIISWRNLAEIKPMDYVVFDHRTLDLFCLIPRRGGGWKLGRPFLTGAIDMRTRKWLAWAIVETPSSDSIATVLKRLFLTHGVPKSVYYDNGRDFRCEYLEGRSTRTETTGPISEMPTAWRGVMDALGIRVHHAIVRRARSKLIEPNFVRTAQFDKSTQFWCGHKPTARPERFDALMEQHKKWLEGQAEPAFLTIKQIADLYDEELKTLNERELQGEGMRVVTPTGHGWACPNQMWETLIPHVARKSVPDETLQFLFAKRRTVTVRNGELRVTFGGQPFHYRLCENHLRLIAYNGREAAVAFDPMDLGTVAVYIDDRFLGLAYNVELRSMGEQDFVQDERDRRRVRREVKKAIGAAYTVPVPGVVERAARRAAVRPERIEPARVEAPAAIPAQIAEAVSAAREDREFLFADAKAGVPILEAGAPTDSRDDVFTFFGGTGHD